MNRISRLLDSLNASEQLIFRLAAICIVIGCVGIGAIALSYVTHKVPEQGGTYIEGVVGYPTTPNPILATTSTDQALSRLVYSGILRKSSWNTYVDDLGSCSTAQTTITCTLAPGAQFHDGFPVTAKDVVFTIESIQKIGDRSPWAQSVVGVTVQKINELTVTFTLPKSFSGFDEVLTIGILPEHIWKNISVKEMESQSTLASMMIGSGPYQVRKHSLQKDKITATHLAVFKKFKDRPAYISRIELHYYGATEDIIKSFNSHNIDGFVLESENTGMITELHARYERIPIIHPDIYGVFAKSQLSTEQSYLTKLNSYLRTVEIAEYGFPWDKPLPPWNTQELVDSYKNRDKIEPLGIRELPSAPTQAQRVLVTVNQEILVELATNVAKVLNSIGLPVETRVFDFSGFKNSIVPKRSFNFLVFGQRYRHISDAYAYWHSSERTDPGLNITETIDATIDKNADILIKRGNTPEQYRSTYNTLQTTISEEHVLLPLYLNRDIYIFRPSSLPIHSNLIYNPTVDRFNSIPNWYINTSLQFKQHIWQN